MILEPILSSKNEKTKQPTNPEKLMKIPKKISISLLLIHKKFLFWIIALFIGFFIGPIQASSRSYLSKNLIEIKRAKICTIEQDSK